MPAAWLAAWYALASVATFAVYAQDKSAARAGGRPPPPRPPRPLGQARRGPRPRAAPRRGGHKSAKQSFLARFWLTVFLNLAALAALQAGGIGFGGLLELPQG